MPVYQEFLLAQFAKCIQNLTTGYHFCPALLRHHHLSFGLWHDPLNDFPATMLLPLSSFSTQQQEQSCENVSQVIFFCLNLAMEGHVTMNQSSDHHNNFHCLHYLLPSPHHLFDFLFPDLTPSFYCFFSNPNGLLTFPSFELLPPPSGI